MTAYLDQRTNQVESELQGPALALHSLKGELANTATHGIGLVLSIAGAIVLLFCSISQADAWRVSGCGVFALTLIAVYAASTLSHCVMRLKLRQFFRTLDQGLIFLLIAGTYTPFALAYLRTGWWWLFLGLMWTLAVCGCISKFLSSNRGETMTVWAYVFLGWLPIIPAVWLIELVPHVALWWIVSGGLCYSIGTVFLIWDIERFHFHVIWHILVISGSACHYFAILFFVACSPVTPV